VPPSRIGTEKESSLHRTLKFRYAGPDGQSETQVGSYVCDGTTDEGEIIEVQTGSFGPFREKIKNLAKTGRVRIVHPVAVQKYIELYDSEGRFIRRRKSPGKNSAWHLFKALLYAPDLPLLPNITIEIALVDVLERRKDDGKGSWRRKGVSITDKILAGWRESIVLSKPGDYYRFLPFDKAEKFTVKDLAAKAGINTTLARKCLYVLSKLGLVERTGKQGNAVVYQILRRRTRGKNLTTKSKKSKKK
jgi:predicted transcriptional regulator